MTASQEGHGSIELLLLLLLLLLLAVEFSTLMNKELN
jgi:hypothetical protein